MVLGCHFCGSVNCRQLHTYKHKKKKKGSHDSLTKHFRSEKSRRKEEERREILWLVPGLWFRPREDESVCFSYFKPNLKQIPFLTQNVIGAFNGLLLANDRVPAWLLCPSPFFHVQ